MKDLIAALEIKDRFTASLLNQFEENLYIIFGFGFYHVMQERIAD